MKVENLIVKYAERLIEDMDKLSEELNLEQTDNPIDAARTTISNKPVLNSLFRKQFILSLLSKIA